MTLLFGVTILFNGCSQFEYDFDISLDEVDLGTHVYGPTVTHKDLENKIVVICNLRDIYTPECIPGLVTLQDKYGCDNLKILVITYGRALPSIHEISSKNYKSISNLERLKKRWKQAGGTDAISVVFGKAEEVDLYPSCMIFDSNGRQVWNGHQRNRMPLNRETITAVKKAIGIEEKQTWSLSFRPL